VPRDHPEVQRLEGRYKNQGGLRPELVVELARARCGRCRAGRSLATGTPLRTHFPSLFCRPIPLAMPACCHFDLRNRTLERRRAPT
jgi:hypothetical protein